MPRVSVCVSVLNQPELLHQTLKSIYEQTFKDWECIVVDDGSTVPIESIVSDFRDSRFSYHRFPENKGIPHGANYAYKLATGDYICSLGCDEFIWNEKLAVQVKYLDENPDISCIWGVPGNGPMGPVQSWEQYIFQAHNRSRELWLKCFLNLEGVPIGGGSAMWRRSLFDSIGYFNPELTAFSDHEWFVRVFEKHQGRILPYRFMNEVPGHKTICTRTEKNAAKLDTELAYVRNAHALQLPKTDGLITVAIPVFNHAKYLKFSLKALLSQTDQNFEVLILDDGSTDDPASVVAQFKDSRIQFARSEVNRGHMNTVNAMLEKAKGEFFVSYSADDTMSPDFLEKCRQEFVKDPFLEYVASQNDFMEEDGTAWEGEHPLTSIEKATNKARQDWLERLRFGNVYFGIGMYRTSALREVGGWDPSHGVISDYEMYLKLLPRYNFRIIEEPLTHTRIHGGNQSLLQPDESKKLARRYYNAQRPYYQPRPKVYIATPFYELKAFSPYCESLAHTCNLLTMHGIQWQIMRLEGDSYVHRARNSIVMNFLNDPWATDLFFIDSDMGWNPDAFVRMLFRPEPVLAGTYPVKNKWEWWTSKPVIYGENEDKHFKGINLPDGNILVEATQLAGGFLRVKRSVFEKYIEFYPMNTYKDTHPSEAERKTQVEFFATGIDREPDLLLLRDIEEEMNKANGSGVEMEKFRDRFKKLKEPRDFIGEDYCFSNRLRNMGIPLFIYPNVSISHFGIQGWSGNFQQFMNDNKREQLKQSQSAEKKGA